MYLVFQCVDCGRYNIIPENNADGHSCHECNKGRLKVVGNGVVIGGIDMGWCKQSTNRPRPDKDANDSIDISNINSESKPIPVNPEINNYYSTTYITNTTPTLADVSTTELLEEVRRRMESNG